MVIRCIWHVSVAVFHSVTLNSPYLLPLIAVCMMACLMTECLTLNLGTWVISSTSQYEGVLASQCISNLPRFYITLPDDHPASSVNYPSYHLPIGWKWWNTQCLWLTVYKTSLDTNFQHNKQVMSQMLFH